LRFRNALINIGREANELEQVAKSEIPAEVKLSNRVVTVSVVGIESRVDGFTIARLSFT
jgi:hypothetical protein